MCPGRYLAENHLYSIVSSVLAVYNVNAPVDELGTPKKLEANYTSGLLSYVSFLRSTSIHLFTYRYPVPFKCTIEPRSKEAESLIRSLSD